MKINIMLDGNEITLEGDFSFVEIIKDEGSGLLDTSLYNEDGELSYDALCDRVKVLVY